MGIILTVAADMADVTDNAMNTATMVGGILLGIAGVFFIFSVAGSIIRRTQTKRSVRKVKKALKPEKEQKGPVHDAYSYSAKRLEGEEKERERVREERRTQWERERKNNPRGR